MKFQTKEEKINSVITKNTFYFFNPDFEEEYEAHITALSQNIFLLKNKIESEGLKEKVLLEHIMNVPNGIDAILTITGFSKESLLRLITFVRVCNDSNLSKLVNKKSWDTGEFKTEWGLDKLEKLIKTNHKFAEGIVNLFFKGATIPIIKNILPLFEFKKLDIKKFSFSIESLIDTIIRYRTKGSYKAKRKGNPESVIENILSEYKLNFDKGKLDLPETENIPRTMDFIVPDKISPKLFIECSYLITTTSAMGDKAKTEQTVHKFIKEKYPHTLFVGFIDGIGWYVRKGDLERMVDAYDFVFTFHNDELNKFKFLLKQVFNK